MLSNKFNKVVRRAQLFYEVHFSLFTLNAIPVEIQYHRRECLYWLAIFEERKTTILSVESRVFICLCPSFEAVLSFDERTNGAQTL